MLSERCLNIEIFGIEVIAEEYKDRSGRQKFISLTLPDGWLVAKSCTTGQEITIYNRDHLKSLRKRVKPNGSSENLP